MSGSDIFFFALLFLLCFCTMLLGWKLWRMLFRNGPHWVGGSPWYVDKRTGFFDYVFFVVTFSVGLAISLGMTILFGFAAVKTYF